MKTKHYDGDVYHVIMGLCKKKEEISHELLRLTTAYNRSIHTLHSSAEQENYNRKIYEEINQFLNEKQKEIDEIYDELIHLLQFRDVQFGL